MSKDEIIPKPFLAKSPWEGGGNPIWPASTIIIHRNLSSFPFPSTMTSGQKEQVNQLICNILLPLLDNPKVLNANTISSHEKEFLFEHFLLNEGFEKFDAGHAIIVDESASFLGLINIEDHLHLHFTATGISIEDQWKRASKIEQTIGKELDLAFSKRFGYLTSDPALCGTGVIVQSYLHLPALLQTDDGRHLLEEENESVIIQGLGQEGEYLADLVLVENRFKLGTTEKDIIETVMQVSKQFEQREASQRKSLADAALVSIKDKISRAYGLLAHSFQLQTHETLSALSLVHLAQNLGWLEGADGISFENLFFNMRRAHLIEHIHEKDLPQEQIAQRRAKLTQEYLKPTNLNLNQ